MNIMVQNREVSFGFKAQNLDASVLNVIEFDFEEGLSCDFRGRIQVASDNDYLTANDVVDKEGCLTIFRNQLPERSFRGIVDSFTKKDTGKNVTFYELTMVPVFARLNLRHNCKIFQEKTVDVILEDVLKDMRITDYDLRLRNAHAQREYCVQYNESDHEFLARILAEEGIFFHFEDKEGKDTVHFSDDNSVLDTLDLPFVYNSMAGGMTTAPYIRQFSTAMKLAQTDAVLKDYSFKSPKYAAMLAARTRHDTGHQGDYEHFIYPGRFKEQAVGKEFSQHRIDYLRKDANTALAVSNLSYAIPGYKFKLEEHPQDEYNRAWLITHVKHRGTQPQALVHTGDSGQTHYENEFACVPSDCQWKPEPQPKKAIEGPQVATVVGPAGEEIYCDEYGRIKLQFPWDRYGKSDENSSCWIRVAHTAAGTSYGNINIPRIGHEVIVHYFDGDPDQPIVTGCTFNGLNRPPSGLPAAKTKMVLRSNSHKSKGFNEISMEDATAGELLYMHAQKDMTTDVLNDRKTDVKKNHTETVGENQVVTVGKNQIVTVGKNQATSVTEVRSVSVKSHQSNLIGGEHAHAVSGMISIVSGTAIRIGTNKAAIVLDGESGNILLECESFSIYAKNSGQITTKNGILDLNMDDAQAPEIASADEKSEIDANIKAAFPAGE